MSFPQGIALRNTAGYVTDGANDWADTSTAADYPQTSTQGNTVGLEGGANYSNRDRNNTIDARLAGMGYTFNNTTTTVRIDLASSGSKNVRIAAGDYNYASNVLIELFDTTTSKGVLASTATTAANKFRDAVNAEYSAAAWPGSNTAVNVTFSTTICRFQMGTTSGGLLYVLAYVYVEDAGGGGGHTRGGAQFVNYSGITYFGATPSGPN